MKNKKPMCILAALMMLIILPVSAAEDSGYAAYTFCDEHEKPTETPPQGEYAAETAAPAITAGEAISAQGNMRARDLLYDKHTNKQFVTLETRQGNPYFLVIDYDQPTDEAGEQYNTFFLNKVDQLDLMNLLEDEEKEGLKESCVCTNKCQPGAVNLLCPVCKKDMTECKGAEPAPTPQPTAVPEAIEPPEPPKADANPAGLLLLLGAAAAGGGAWYFIKRRGAGQSKRGNAASLRSTYDEYEFEEEEDDEDGMDEKDGEETT